MSRNFYGFTMVEVMIVLLIIGMISAVAVPSIKNSLDEMKLDGVAREIVSMIYYCQSISIKEGDSHQVNFNVVQDKAKCQHSATSVIELNPIDKKPWEIDFKVAGYFQGVDIVNASFNPGNKSAVSFNSLGEADKFGSVVLGYLGNQKTINVALPLGKVSVN
jgi:prepilin-type N-terminal cleavage/methylation domain-containing protein